MAKESYNSGYTAGNTDGYEAGYTKGKEDGATVA
jgi:flagellar biosynthesis/type III secretory pathway protein FliH